MGMLPEIADDLGVSVSAVGILISAYAIGVVIGAPTLTALGLRFTPRQTLVALMVVFVVGNALAALAPSYGTARRGPGAHRARARLLLRRRRRRRPPAGAARSAPPGPSR